MNKCQKLPPSVSPSKNHHHIIIIKIAQTLFMLVYVRLNVIKHLGRCNMFLSSHSSIDCADFGDFMQVCFHHCSGGCRSFSLATHPCYQCLNSSFATYTGI